MTPKQLWVAAYRLNRALNNVRVQYGPNQVKNGLYPSWLPQPEYRRFLQAMRDADLVRSWFYTDDKLNTPERQMQRSRVKSLMEDLLHDERVDLPYVRRHITEGLRDLYHAW